MKFVFRINVQVRLPLVRIEYDNSLKMQSFCAVFNCLNRADREENKYNWRFPPVVKNNSKEGLKLSKVRRKKWLTQIFWKALFSSNF